MISSLKKVVVLQNKCFEVLYGSNLEAGPGMAMMSR
jgi:hypothetical protein